MQIANYINGKLTAPNSGDYIDNIDPAIGEPYGRVPDSDERDIATAVAAARDAFPGWSATPAAERSAILLRIAQLIKDNFDDIAMAECIDTGKPHKLARSVDIPRAIANLKFFATAILHMQSESHITDSAAINYTLRRPHGVVGLISPWNLPLYLLTWKIAPALATGNTAVAKPSEITPMTAFLLSELCIEAGLPPGVLNIVHGLGAKVGAALAVHDDVAAISFTGGTATGASIAESTSRRFKKLALEMGGKNPNIVFADADMDGALDTSIRSAFSNQGQLCLSGSRIFVESSVYGDFVNRFVDTARELKVGDPLDDSCDQGALVSQAQLDKTKYYVDLARDEGGNILCGGKRPTDKEIGERCAGGFFYEPTVVNGLAADCRVNQEEIFGPVVSISPFDTEDEVIEYANGTNYGLAASVWTKNLDRAHRVADRIECGTVWVNCWMLRDLRVPFGGMKESGLGREGGEEALRFFTEPKNVCVALHGRS